MAEKPRTKKSGTVRKIIVFPEADGCEKAEIELPDGEHLHKEIRIENTLEDSNGKKVGLQQNAGVAVTIEADARHSSEGRWEKLVTPRLGNLLTGLAAFQLASPAAAQKASTLHPVLDLGSLSFEFMTHVSALWPTLFAVAGVLLLVRIGLGLRRAPGYLRASRLFLLVAACLFLVAGFADIVGRMVVIGIR